MAHRTLDFTNRTLRINLARDSYRQTSTVGVDGIVNRSRQLVRIQRAGPDTILTYFDSHSLKYIIKTVRNIDEETGEPKSAFVGPVTWNAQQVKRWRGLSDGLELNAQEEAEVQVIKEPETDLDWKSDVRFFGVRDALLGEVSYRSRER